MNLAAAETADTNLFIQIKTINKVINYMKNNSKFIQKSELLKALAHPTRLYIVKGLMEKESNVTNIQECLDLPQSTVSQHLFKLKAAGIIKGERKGLEISYQVINEDVRKIIKTLFPRICMIKKEGRCLTYPLFYILTYP